ncbi:hypothetical protein KIPB_006981, partial [Kipferlia bialata]
ISDGRARTSSVAPKHYISEHVYKEAATLVTVLLDLGRLSKAQTEAVAQTAFKLLSTRIKIDIVSTLGLCRLLSSPHVHEALKSTVVGHPRELANRYLLVQMNQNQDISSEFYYQCCDALVRGAGYDPSVLDRQYRRVYDPSIPLVPLLDTATTAGDTPLDPSAHSEAHTNLALAEVIKEVVASTRNPMSLPFLNRYAPLLYPHRGMLQNNIISLIHKQASDRDTNKLSTQLVYLVNPVLEWTQRSKEQGATSIPFEVSFCNNVVLWLMKIIIYMAGVTSNNPMDERRRRMELRTVTDLLDTCLCVWSTKEVDLVYTQAHPRGQSTVIFPSTILAAAFAESAAPQGHAKHRSLPAIVDSLDCVWRHKPHTFLAQPLPCLADVLSVALVATDRSSVVGGILHSVLKHFTMERIDEVCGKRPAIAPTPAFQISTQHGVNTSRWKLPSAAPAKNLLSQDGEGEAEGEGEGDTDAPPLPELIPSDQAVQDMARQLQIFRSHLRKRLDSDVNAVHSLCRKIAMAVQYKRQEISEQGLGGVNGIRQPGGAMGSLSFGAKAGTPGLEDIPLEMADTGRAQAKATHRVSVKYPQDLYQKLASVQQTVRLICIMANHNLGWVDPYLSILVKLFSHLVKHDVIGNLTVLFPIRTEMQRLHQSYSYCRNVHDIINHTLPLIIDLAAARMTQLTTWYSVSGQMHRVYKGSHKMRQNHDKNKAMLYNLKG